ncbi:MAG TPA: tetratricopeptide repeat protein [Kofleriaceae bacterium]|jgi:tetratricopeptide (TPR) repeat protein
MRSVLLIAVLSVASVAGANVWERAVVGDSGALDAYRDAMSQGDGYVQQATAMGVTYVQTKELVEKAIAAYQLAATKRPDEGEPYFRIAETLGTFYTDCPLFVRSGMGVPLTCGRTGRPSKLDPARGQQASDAWDEFEKRAPLDPRVNDARFERAILRTKLVDTAHDAKPLLERALEDYQSLLDRADGTSNFEPETVWGNLAETYMMLGRLEEAIDAYKVAVSMGANASTSYGLAVALDRDDSPAEALDVIRAQGIDAVRQYIIYFKTGAIFYVPDGEEHYYIALLCEAWGHPYIAAVEWQAFIASGAHARYQARAKQHLAEQSKLAKQHPEERSLTLEEIFDL